MPGYFVDWDGFTRSVDSPGDGYTCGPVTKNSMPSDDGNGVTEWGSVDVIARDGEVVHYGVVHATLDDLRAAGVEVQFACGKSALPEAIQAEIRSHADYGDRPEGKLAYKEVLALNQQVRTQFASTSGDAGFCTVSARQLAILLGCGLKGKAI